MICIFSADKQYPYLIIIPLITQRYPLCSQILYPTLRQDRTLVFISDLYSNKVYSIRGISLYMSRMTLNIPQYTFSSSRNMNPRHSRLMLRTAASSATYRVHRFVFALFPRRNIGFGALSEKHRVREGMSLVPQQYLLSHLNIRFEKGKPGNGKNCIFTLHVCILTTKPIYKK